MKYTTDDINIDDKVYFEMPSVNNYDLYWTVKQKGEKWLRLEIKEMGVRDTKLVEIEYIKNKLCN
jgi:hypothetical protein